MKKECYIKSADAKVGIIKNTLNTISAKASLDNNLLLQQSPILKHIVGATTAFKDNNTDVILNLIKSNNDFHAYFKNKGVYGDLSKDINNYIKTVHKEHKKLGVELKFKKSTNTDSETKFEPKAYFDTVFNGKYDSNEIKMIEDQIYSIQDLLRSSGYNELEIMNYFTKNGNAIDNILVGILATPEIDILQYMIKNNPDVPLNKKDIKDFLKEHIQNDFKDIASKKHTENFVEDLFGEGVFKGFGKTRKLLKEFRIASDLAKFSLLPGTNIMYGLNAFVLSNANFYAKMRGIDNIYSHSVIDDLFNDFNFLKSETRRSPTIEDKTDGLGESMINNTIDWFSGKTVGKVLSKSKTEIINTGLKGGSQALVDVGLEGRAKRLAISQALSKHGINSNNIDLFKEGLKDLDKDILNTIRADASIYYNRFFTNSSLAVNNRDRFSRWVGFNYLQHYVTARSAEMFDGLRILNRDWQSGKLSKTPIGEYLNQNQELKSLIMGLLHSATIGHYVNVYVNDSEPHSDDTRKMWAFTKNLSDHLGSFDALLIRRVLMAPYENGQVLYNYNKSTGNQSDLIEYGLVGISSMTSELIRSLFRELKIGNVPIGSARAAIEGHSMDVILKNIDTEFDKAVNGMGRFGAIPGFEKYGLQKVPERDDAIGYFLMGLDDTNASIDGYIDLLKISNITNIIENGLLGVGQQAWMNMSYMPIISSFGGKNTVGSEVKYKKFLDLREKDQVIKDLYNGNFNDAVLKTNGQFDLSKTDKFYKELIRFDYGFAASKIKEDGTSAIWDSLSAGKDEIFIQQVMDKIGEQQFFATLDSSGYNLDKQGLRKMIMMAENEVKGSSRVILSYIAQQEYSKITENINKEQGRYGKSDAKMSDEDKVGLQAYIIKKYYPDIATFDRESWFKLIEQRAEELEPGLFKMSKDKQHFVNSLSLIDYVQYSEGKKADPNINMIKNIYNVIGKYINDPTQRINVINYAMETVDTLPINEDVKTMMKVGNMLGNMDIANKLMKNTKFMEENGDVMNKYLDIMFSVNDELNNKGTKLAITDLNNDGKKSWDSNGFKNNYGKYSNGYPANNVNSGLVNDFKNKVPLPGSLPKTYQRGAASNIQQPYSFKDKVGAVMPNIAKTYMDIKNDLRKATTQKLVSGYVRKYPADFMQQLKWKERNSVRINKIKPKGNNGLI